MVTLMAYISNCGDMLKRSKFLWTFLFKGFGEKCEQTELALTFIQKQVFN